MAGVKVVWHMTGVTDKELTLKLGRQPGDLMRDAWKQEKLMRLYDARKKLLSRVETTFRSPVNIKIKHFYNEVSRSNT